MPAIPAIVLDHVAVAMERQTDAWPRYAGDLPARWIGGGGTAGFASAQVEYANGMRLEVLEPYAVEQNDFLRRFLDRNGSGPHHLTFKVEDIVGALDLVELAGYRPVSVNLANEWWKEAFIHPKDAPGIVVQLAQPGGDDWGDDVPPAWYPEPRVAGCATLAHVALAVADLDEALALFRDLLGGEAVVDDIVDGVRRVELAWPGPGRLRLVSGAQLTGWIGERSGRVHHLAFVVDDPEGVPDAVALGNGVFEVPPAANLGVRLVLAARQAPFLDTALGYVPDHG